MVEFKKMMIGSVNHELYVYLDLLCRSCYTNIQAETDFISNLILVMLS